MTLYQSWDFHFGPPTAILLIMEHVFVYERDCSLHGRADSFAAAVAGQTEHHDHSALVQLLNRLQRFS